MNFQFFSKFYDNHKKWFGFMGFLGVGSSLWSIAWQVWERIRFDNYNGLFNAIEKINPGANPNFEAPGVEILIYSLVSGMLLFFVMWTITVSRNTKYTCGRGLCMGMGYFTAITAMVGGSLAYFGYTGATAALALGNEVPVGANVMIQTSGWLCLPFAVGILSYLGIMAISMFCCEGGGTGCASCLFISGNAKRPANQAIWREMAPRNVRVV